MSINIRAKGQNGEREVAKAMNEVIMDVMRGLGFPESEIAKAANAVQRNQNQSAVGGNDLSNTFGLSIEVKRQEQLSINTWWKQCEAAAQRNNEIPVLLYRQNGKKWRCITYSYLPLPNGSLYSARVEFDWDTFLDWFKDRVKLLLMSGQGVRT